jgi:hypothetical protein
VPVYKVERNASTRINNKQIAIGLNGICPNNRRQSVRSKCLGRFVQVLDGYGGFMCQPDYREIPMGKLLQYGIA